MILFLFYCYGAYWGIEQIIKGTKKLIKKNEPIKADTNIVPMVAPEMGFVCFLLFAWCMVLGLRSSIINLMLRMDANCTVLMPIFW